MSMFRGRGEARQNLAEDGEEKDENAVAGPWSFETRRRRRGPIWAPSDDVIPFLSFLSMLAASARAGPSRLAVRSNASLLSSRTSAVALPAALAFPTRAASVHGRRSFATTARIWGHYETLGIPKNATKGQVKVRKVLYAWMIDPVLTVGCRQASTRSV
jgi:hypothetical protein